MIRSIVRAVKVKGAPAAYDTVFAKITYPAVYTGTLAERNSGVLAADPARGKMPVVLFLSGINVGKEAYLWLAMALAEAGIVTVTYDWIAEDMPGHISLTAGVDLGAIGPDTYGTRPTCTVIKPLLLLLDTLQAAGVLADALDLERIYLGGHSAGGTMAFQNTNDEWFPQIQGAFGYAGHTMASTLFGYESGTILPIKSNRPILVMGGSDDNVIAGSSHRYGLAEGSATAALERTFDEAVNNGSLVIFEGANHFSFVHPHDPTTGRGFLEEGEPADSSAVRAQIAQCIIQLIQNRPIAPDKSTPDKSALDESAESVALIRHKDVPS